MWCGEVEEEGGQGGRNFREGGPLWAVGFPIGSGPGAFGGVVLGLCRGVLRWRWVAVRFGSGGRRFGCAVLSKRGEAWPERRRVLRWRRMAPHGWKNRKYFCRSVTVGAQERSVLRRGLSVLARGFSASLQGPAAKAQNFPGAAQPGSARDRGSGVKAGDSKLGLLPRSVPGFSFQPRKPCLLDTTGRGADKDVCDYATASSPTISTSCFPAFLIQNPF